MDFDKLKNLLDDQYDWPSEYTFKFVGQDHHRDELAKHVGEDAHKEQPSKSGKYISYTFKITISSSDEVIEIYKKVSSISGIISL